MCVELTGLQVTRPPKVADYQTSLVGSYSRHNLNDNVSNDSSTSERINMIGSEDELSTSNFFPNKN